MVEQLLQTISRELSVVDVMGVFRGTHTTPSPTSHTSTFPYRLHPSPHHTPPPPTFPYRLHPSLITPLTTPHPSTSHIPIPAASLTHHSPHHIPPSISHPHHLGSIEPLQQLQPALINFIREHCLNGAKPTPERKETAVTTFLGGCIPAVTSIQVCWNPLVYITAYPRT